MNKKIKILHLEDSVNDSELICATIEKGKIEYEYFLAENEKEYLRILVNEKIDIILCDYNLPEYNGIDALNVAREKYSFTPFIFVSGTMGEDVAIEAILNGATDYVLKNNLIRLVPAINRALSEHELAIHNKLAEEALKVSEAKYRRLFESAKDGILILDADTGMIVDVNPFLVEMLGYSHNAFMGKAIWDIGLFKDLFYNKEHFCELKKKEFIRYDDLPLETFDGHKINVEFISNVYNVDGKKVIQCNIRNISERKQAEELLYSSQQLIEEIINTIPVRVFWKDMNLKFLGCNLIFAKDAGFTNTKDIIGKDDYQMVWCKDAKLYREDDFRVIESNCSSINIEESQTTMEGNVKTLLTSKIPLCGSNGETIGLLGTYIDITDRKNAELGIIAAKEKVEELSKLKTNFLANMSHEIRTPLNGILGFAGILKDDLKNVEQKRFAEIIEKSGNRLLETLDLILNFAKLEAEKQDINYSNVKIEDIIYDTIYTFEKMASLKGIYLNSVIKVKNFNTKSDERFISQILNNLVNNAIKFTNTGGVIVELSKENNNAVIKVIDTGIGIVKDDLEVIFEEFRQESEGFARSFEGTGLGLSITKKFVELMKGKISVESEKGKGSVFIVTLPCEDFSKSTNIKLNNKECEIPESVKTKKNRFSTPILIVEDDEDNRVYISTILSQYNFEYAINGYEAIEKAKEKKFEIILMDINLGKGMDGIGVVNEIRKIDFYKKTPIVAMTAFVLEGEREEFLHAGCTHYLGKPFKKQQLLELLNSIESEKL